jgi:hypothetical protein
MRLSTVQDITAQTSFTCAFSAAIIGGGIDTTMFLANYGNYAAK